MARILAISSQVVYGPVGNTAAVPALQSLGHEVMQVPTVLLSHHPGHGRPEGQATSVDLFEKLLASVQSAGGFENCDAVITGYFASAAQVAIAADAVRKVAPQHVLVDPVIGDHGKLYVAEDTAAAIRDLLLPLASIATPNIFELGWLTGEAVASQGDAVRAAHRLGPQEVIITSVSADTQIETLLVAGTSKAVHVSARRELVPNGTGDFLSGLYLGHRLLKPPELAFKDAMRVLDRAIALSAGSRVLAVAQALRE